MKIDCNEISKVICENFELLLDTLDIEMKKYGNRFESHCFFHSGDNNHALTVYPEKDRFYCYTHECHKSVFNSLLGFARLALSYRKMNWQKPRDKLFSFRRHPSIY